jgi:alpha-L-fucosidase 2
VVPATLATVVIAFLGVVDSKALWSRTPASGGRLMRDAYPLGNGRLGAMPFGPPGQEKLNLNLDTLWNGGPFEASVCLARTETKEGTRL